MPSPTGRLPSNPNAQDIPVRTESGDQVRAAFMRQREERPLKEENMENIALRALALRHQGTSEQQQERETGVRPFAGYRIRPGTELVCAVCGQECGHRTLAPGALFVVDEPLGDGQVLTVLCIACIVAGIEASE